MLLSLCWIIITIEQTSGIHCRVYFCTSTCNMENIKDYIWWKQMSACSFNDFISRIVTYGCMRVCVSGKKSSVPRLYTCGNMFHSLALRKKALGCWFFSCSIYRPNAETELSNHCMTVMFSVLLTLLSFPSFSFFTQCQHHIQ